MDWLKLIYENLGAKAPSGSIFIVTVLGAIIFGGAWWLLGKQYEKDHPPTAPPLSATGQSVTMGAIAPERHVSKDQAEAIRRALSNYPPSALGIATLRGKPERANYAKD